MLSVVVVLIPQTYHEVSAFQIQSCLFIPLHHRVSIDQLCEEGQIVFLKHVGGSGSPTVHSSGSYQLYIVIIVVIHLRLSLLEAAFTSYLKASGRHAGSHQKIPLNN